MQAGQVEASPVSKEGNVRSVGADAIRRVTYQHVQIRSLLRMLPLVCLTTSMALVSSGLVSDYAGRVLALGSIAAVALAYFLFRRTFGVVVPTPPPRSEHVVRDSLIGLGAFAVVVSVPLLVWVNVARLGLLDLAYLLGAGSVIAAGVTISRRWYWIVPAALWALILIGMILRVSGLLMASLALLVAILAAVILEYRSFVRRLTDGR